MVTTQIPHLRRTATSQQLIVEGKPFLILGGELQNSSSSSSEYMRDVWDNLAASNFNTILASVSWEQIEPTEGVFDFTELDQLLHEARRRGIRIVLLWFGSFKNGMPPSLYFCNSPSLLADVPGLSTYTPPWVKQNALRFPRARLQRKDNCQRLELGDVLSVFSNESVAADARAFKTLMQHVKRVDQQYSTVIMVQVENEVGLLGDSRDRSELAEKTYTSCVPASFLAFLKSDRRLMNENLHATLSEVQHHNLHSRLTWKDLPCREKLRDELFMAYHYSLFLNCVASAGKSVYPIPLYTNVWQNYGDSDRDKNAPLVAAGGSLPGDYPSGGGVPNVLDVWLSFATSLDFIAPDIYLNDYVASCAKYRHRGQALFIPEQRRDEYGAVRIWSAFGSHQCIGTAPFGVDTVSAGENPFTKHYALLSKVSDVVLDAQARQQGCVGFFFDEVAMDGRDPSPPIEAKFGTWCLTITRSFVFGRPAVGYGIVIHGGDDQFLLVGRGFQVTFTSNLETSVFTGILKMEEKDFDAQGSMRTVRLLNGDETRSGRAAVMPSEQPDYGGFPISITIPARTGIAMCQPYAI